MAYVLRFEVNVISSVSRAQRCRVTQFLGGLQASIIDAAEIL